MVSGWSRMKWHHQIKYSLRYMKINRNNVRHEGIYVKYTIKFVVLQFSIWNASTFLVVSVIFGYRDHMETTELKYGRRVLKLERIFLLLL
jgi:hypothetical protein